MASKRSRIKRIAKNSDAPIVGVAVTITPHRNTHAGVIYHDAAGNVRILHLAFHLKLEEIPWDASYLCVVPNLEDEDAEVVAAHCRLIADGKPTIHFAIHYNPKARLQKVGGTVLLLHEGKGLNCSTFVLTVFESAGPKLLTKVGWEKRESDKSWQRFLVNLLRSHNAPLTYVKRVAKDIGCARVRPEEVAGACLERDLPANFSQCEPNGLAVISELAKHTKRTIKAKWD